MPRRFTLLDDVYFEALLAAVTALSEGGLQCMLVGGGAVQTWVAFLRTEAGNRRLSDEPALGAALRKTGDLDFATSAAPEDALALFHRLAATYPGVHVIGPRAVRFGAVSLAVTLGPDDLAGMADRYDAFLASRTELGLRRGNQLHSIPTIGLAELFATKLTRRGDKAKDLLDVSELMAALAETGWPLDLDRLRVLCGGNQEALALLDEVAAALCQGGQG